MPLFIILLNYEEENICDLEWVADESLSGGSMSPEKEEFDDARSFHARPFLWGCAQPSLILITSIPFAPSHLHFRTMSFAASTGFVDQSGHHVKEQHSEKGPGLGNGQHKRHAPNPRDPFLPEVLSIIGSYLDRHSAAVCLLVLANGIL